MIIIKNIFVYSLQNKNIVYKNNLPISESIVNKINNLINDTWLNERMLLNSDKSETPDLYIIKETSKLFVVENKKGDIIASSMLSLNEKSEDYLVEHKIKEVLNFPNYYFNSLVVQKNYQRMGLGNQLINIRKNFIKTTNVKTGFCFASNKNRINIEKNGFILYEDIPIKAKGKPGDIYPYILKL